MSRTLQSTSEVHHDHRVWQSENIAWREDIERWQAEHIAAQMDLRKLEKSIKQHGDALEAHLAAINEHDQTLSAHELALAESAYTGECAALTEDLESSHHQQAIKHVRQREAHERIKRHHHAVMAQLALLTKLIDRAL